MNAANLPPASVLRPELRARLERLEHLERRERQSRYARWHIPAPVEREPEGWLLTYLDLITLLLVMLVVMLAFSQPKTPLAEVATVAALPTQAPGATPPQEGSTLEAVPGTAHTLPGTQAASPSPADAGAAAALLDSSLPALPDTPHEMPLVSEGALASLPVASAVPGEPTTALSETAPAAAQEPAIDPAFQPADMADRPAPVDVALVGSVRSSSLLQAALPLTFDLQDMSANPAPAATPGTPLEAAVRPVDAVQDPSPSETTPSASPLASADTPARSAEPAARPPASLEDLGLNGLGDNIDVIINEESVSFRINNEILFTSGQADLMTSGLEVLTRLAGVLVRNNYQIAVEGHTDPVPIQNGRFPSNWELSTGRATSVLRHLQSQGIPASRLRATGYADTRPIAPNDSPAGRAFNRRVELIMEMPRKTSQSSSSTSTDGTPSLLSGSESAAPIVRLR